MKLFTLILSAVIGLWKAVSGKVRRIRKSKKEAVDEVKKGLKKRDASSVNMGFNRIKRLRGK